MDLSEIEDLSGSRPGNNDAGSAQAEALYRMTRRRGHMAEQDLDAWLSGELAIESAEMDAMKAAVATARQEATPVAA